MNSTSSTCTSVCPVGQYSAAGAQYCTPCPSGSFSSVNGSSNCTAGCTAAPGRYGFVHGTVSADMHAVNAKVVVVFKFALWLPDIAVAACRP